MSFSELNKLHESYSTFREYGFNKISVRSHLVNEFGKSLSAVNKQLNELEIQDNWLDYTIFMRKFFYSLCTSPIDPKRIHKFVNENFCTKDQKASFTRLDNITKSLFIKNLDDFDNIFTGTETNPLANALIEVMETNDLGKEEKLRFLFPIYSFKSKDVYSDFLESLLYRNGLIDSFSFDVVTYAQARNTSSTYDFTCIFGSPKWLQKIDEFHLLSSPKSRELILFAYSHFDNATPDIDSFNFDDSIKQNKLPEHELDFVNDEPSDDAQIETEIIPDIVLPSPPVNISAPAAVQGDDLCDAYLYILYGEQLLYNDTEGSFFTIDYVETFNSLECNSIVRKKCADVVGGDVVLISSSGGGDMIKPTADRILEKKWGRLEFESRTELQSAWKSKLRTLYLDLQTHVIDHLERRAVYCNLANVRYWISADGIGPADDTTFMKLLECLGFYNCIDVIIPSAKEIRSAHQKAGRQLANQLRSSIVGKSLNGLRDNGVQKFSHHDIEGEQSAFLVEKRESKTFKVSQNNLLKVYEAESSSWL